MPQDISRCTRQVGGCAVRVWDLPIRLFHWTLVASVGTAAVTGFLAAEWWLGVHVWAGYAVGALLVLRIVWGLLGPTYARFSSFAFSPRATFAYVRDLFTRRNRHYVGHNPAGAQMVFCLLCVLSGLVISGLIVFGGQENNGVLAGFVNYRSGQTAAAIHQALAIALLLMIAGHIAGVISESVHSRSNLLRAMITGRKIISGEVVAAHVSRPMPGVAVLLVAAIAVAGASSVAVLKRVPASGLIAMPQNPAWTRECGDCHYAYHPSLLPARSWQLIMSDLSNHFGEDASLGAADTRSIMAYLTKNAAEAWDTEASNNLRLVDPKAPKRITATAYWRRRHRDIDKATFARQPIGSKGNCIACHRDAASGRFDDVMIKIPAPKPRPNGG